MEKALNLVRFIQTTVRMQVYYVKIQNKALTTIIISYHQLLIFSEQYALLMCLFIS